ncbi:MAG: nickel pincer cofactor biosynthesis protein LarB [Euryarchaeota archaeon]|nr:nickel pincer cofactor biosynthesis protein LarB [Euryarchaeota archaeon]
MSIRDVLERHSKGEINISEAERLLRMDYIRRIGEHTLFDARRAERKGVPEIIYGESKDANTIADIIEGAMAERDVLLVSRSSLQQFEAVRDRIPEARYEDEAKMIILDRRKEHKEKGIIGLLAGGSSDISTAEEARVVAEAMGCRVMTAYDVGIAAFHRFIEPLHNMLESGADALVVVAGMEGALASVVSSLVDVPVIGVPTSVGYGVGEGGKVALASMLQSCSPGLVTVNIDNGVGAGITAALISIRCRRSQI